MLTAYQIDALRDKSTQLLDPIIDFLIEDIAKRVSEAGQLTGTASYQVWRLQKLGVSQREIKKEIQKRLKVSQKEVEQLLTQAAETGYNFDLSRFPNKRATPFVANTSIQQILDTAVKMAQEDLLNITQTIGFICPDGEARTLTKAYQSACDFAFTKVATGAQDFHSALRDATKGLAEKGILSIDYESGVHTSLEAAVRRNIMGGLGLMQERISQQNHDDLGCDGWEISAHSGSAPDHEPIQGKQYPDKVYKRLNDSLKRRIGTLNCGHAASPIIMGVNEPQYTPEELEKFRQENEEGVTVDGKHYTKYEATQRQRGLERAARKQKRRILIDEAAGDTEKLQQDQIKLVRIRQEYKRFSDAAGLRMQHERMNTAGFTWKHGKAAEKTEKTYRDIAKMAQSNATSNDWSETIPRAVTKEEKASLIAYAEEKGIKITGLKKFDGDPELLKSGIDALSQISTELPIGKDVILSISQSLPDDDFAETNGNHITLNGKALRNRKITEANIAAGGKFASTKCEDIFVHEYGHVVASVKGNKGVEIARKACYNISKGNLDTDDLLDFLRSDVSLYATTYSSKKNDKYFFDTKRFKEIIPEVLAKNNSNPTEFSSEFVALLKELF